MVSIKKYTNSNIKVWNDFINLSNNGTVFNKQTFLAYHIQKKFNNHSLIIKKNNSVVALLSAAIIADKNKTVLYSHPGASYGGLVYKKNISFELINQIIIALNQYCYKQKFDSIVLINAPHVYYQHYSESEQYLLLWHKYNIVERYISHIVDLKTKKKIINLLSKRKQRYLKNGYFKKFFCKRSQDLNNFYPLLLKSKKRYQTKPTHSLEELKKIKKTFPNQSDLLLSYYNNKIVGGSFLFFLNSKICLVFYNIIDENYRDSQLSVYQLYSCMELAYQRGCALIDLGVSQTPETTNPLEPKMSLIKFKEQFGALGVIRNVYQKDFYYEK